MFSGSNQTDSLRPIPVASIACHPVNAIADAPRISYCGELEAPRFGGIVRIRRVVLPGSDRVDLIYCDTRGECHTVFSLMSEDLIAVQWSAPFQLRIETDALSADNKKILVNLSPAGAKRAATVALTESELAEEGDLIPSLTFQPDDCRAAPSPVASNGQTP